MSSLTFYANLLLFLFAPAIADGFPLESDCEFPQVSRPLFINLAAQNNAVIWMVFTRPLILKFYSPSTNPLVTEPSEPVTIGITDYLLILLLLFREFFTAA